MPSCSLSLKSVVLYSERLAQVAVLLVRENSKHSETVGRWWTVRGKVPGGGTGRNQVVIVVDGRDADIAIRQRLYVRAGPVFSGGADR